MYAIGNLKKLPKMGYLAPEDLKAAIAEQELAETVHVAAAI